MSSEIALSESKINIIVAHTERTRTIGHKNDLPWKRKLRGDLMFLSTLTSSPDIAVIMGRKTFESLPCPLKNRVNIILTRKSDYLNETTHSKNSLVRCFPSLKESIKFCKNNNLKIVIFGGSAVYKEALENDYKIFCTIIENNEFEGDTFFPECDCSLVNISENVNNYLTKKGVKKSWELKENMFIENEITYKFFTGEKSIE